MATRAKLDVAERCFDEAIVCCRGDDYLLAKIHIFRAHAFFDSRPSLVEESLTQFDQITQGREDLQAALAYDYRTAQSVYYDEAGEYQLSWENNLIAIESAGRTSGLDYSIAKSDEFLTRFVLGGVKGDAVLAVSEMIERVLPWQLPEPIACLNLVKGSALCQAGRFQEAEIVHRILSVPNRPSRLYGYRLLVRTLIWAGKTDEAITVLHEILALDVCEKSYHFRTFAECCLMILECSGNGSLSGELTGNVVEKILCSKVTRDEQVALLHCFALIVLRDETLHIQFAQKLKAARIFILESLGRAQHFEIVAFNACLSAILKNIGQSHEAAEIANWVRSQCIGRSYKAVLDILDSKSEGKPEFDEVGAVDESIQKNYDIFFDDLKLTVTVAGRIFGLGTRPQILKILRYLARNPGLAVSKEDLVRDIWAENYNPLVHDTRIYTNIKRLRQLLEEQDRRDWLVSAEGMYMLRPHIKVGSTPSQ